MKYEYGVEYATGFNCPSLPGDVMVEARYSDGNWHRDGADRFDEFNWASFSHFRIVDERYKPAEKENNWFERGELPPVGIECEAYDFSNSQWVKVKTLDATRLCEKAVACVTVGGTGAYGRLVWASDFRLVKTDREKAIEAAKAALLKTGSMAITANLETLYDAGLLRLPEEK